jgi:hypothetical protein
VEGGDARRTGWQTLTGLALEALPAIVGAIGFVGFVALIGGAIEWTRFWAAELPADQAVQAIPESELVTVGAVSTIVFTLLGLAAVLLVFLLDRRGDLNARTRWGLLVVVGFELAASVLIIELRWWETLLFVVWALAVTVAAYRPIEHLAAVLGPRMPTPDPDPRNGPRLEAERKRLDAAREEHAEALDAWEVARARPRPQAELDAARNAWERAQDAWDLAQRRWRRIEAEQKSRTSPDDKPQKSRTSPDDKPADKPAWRLTGWDILALALVVVGLAVLLAYDATRWLLYVLAVPLILYVALLGIARATSRFAWYGVAVFLSVPLFGGVLAVADVLHTPRVQPIALVRDSDDRALCGVYITQTDDRLYVGRVELERGSDREAESDTGRIFSVPLEDVDVASVGPLQPIADARSRAIRLLDEVYVDRAEEPPTEVKNEVTVTERQETLTEPATVSGGQPGQTTSKLTRTTETPADRGRPTRREPPSDHPPDRCGIDVD